MSKDTIYRQAAIEAIHEDADWLAAQGSDWQIERMERDKSILKSLPSAQPELAQNLHTTCTDAISRQAAIDAFWKLEAELRPSAIDAVLDMLKNLPSAQPEIIHCCDCIYYDPEYIEKNGVRYEYKDMPKDAFGILGIGLVSVEYGVNVGGRCCRDYNVGYSEDKRVYVSEQNYCGRAERR